MDISRRVLLRAGAVCAAIAAFPVAVGAKLLEPRSATRVPRFSLDSFDCCRNELFDVVYEGGRASLRLVEVKDLIDTTSGDDRDCFSLLFHSSASPALKQGTHRFSHPKLGAFVLFLVPVNQPLPDGSAHYAAIFNRRPRAL